MKLPIASLALVLTIVATGCGDDADAEFDAGGAPKADAATVGDSSRGGSDGSVLATADAADGSKAPNDAAAVSDAAAANDAAAAVDAGVEFVGTPWVDVTNNLATLAAGGGELSLISSQPGTQRVIAGVAKGTGLFATDTGGDTWFPLGTGASSAKVSNGPMAIVYDPVHKATWWEVGIYGEGLFRTDDNGVTFVHLGDSSHNDLVSVDFTDEARKTLLLGPHEARNTLFLSRDQGNTWMNIGGNLPADSSFSTMPLVLDAQTFLLGACGNSGGGACGVFRSENGGTTWKQTTTLGPWQRPLVAKDGTIYWSTYGDGMIVSSDRGLTWTKAADAAAWMNSPILDELPDGRVVAVGKEYLLATNDKGKTWRRVSSRLPTYGSCGATGLAYVAALKAFFINQRDCSGLITGSKVYRSGFDFEQH